MRRDAERKEGLRESATSPPMTEGEQEDAMIVTVPHLLP